MNYEKKYKEALELARVAAFNGHQSLMEGIFPELAESEDEKTRKDILVDVKFEGYNNDMLANSYKKINWLKSLKQRIKKETV